MYIPGKPKLNQTYYLMKNLLFSTLVVCLAAIQVNAQTRYLDEIFDEVQVTSDVQYGTNITILPALQGLPPAAEALMLDIYEPVGDTELNDLYSCSSTPRNFLPPMVNGGTQGTRTDNTVVEICERYARMGYVTSA